MNDDRYAKADLALAVQAFMELERLQHQLHRKETALAQAVQRIRDEQMTEYVERTEKLRMEIALKCRQCHTAEVAALM